MTATLGCGIKESLPGTGGTSELLSSVSSGELPCRAREAPCKGPAHTARPSRALGSLSEAGSAIFLVLMPHQDQGVRENRDVNELKQSSFSSPLNEDQLFPNHCQQMSVSPLFSYPSKGREVHFFLLTDCVLLYHH